MSINAKHSYRFGFLKSEKWQDIRIRCFVALGTKCYICPEDSVFNDVHHVVYPKNLSKTNPGHVRPLCRRCHALVHEIMSNKPSKSTDSKGEKWKLFLYACAIAKSQIGIPLDSKDVKHVKRMQNTGQPVA